jgi:hypothetical protein
VKYLVFSLAVFTLVATWDHCARLSELEARIDRIQRCCRPGLAGGVICEDIYCKNLMLMDDEGNPKITLSNNFGTPTINLHGRLDNEGRFGSITSYGIDFGGAKNYASLSTCDQFGPRLHIGHYKEGGFTLKATEDGSPELYWGEGDKSKEIDFGLLFKDE